MGFKAREGIESREKGSTPSNPVSGLRALYPKADGWYDLTSAGVETKLAAGGGSFTDPEAAPSYAGTRSKPFNAETSFYNVTDTSMQLLRTKLALAATQRVRVNFAGHSIFAGSFTSQIGSFDIASQTRRFLNSEGAKVNGSGFTLISQNAGASPALGRDYRYTSITGWTLQNNVSFPWASTTTNGAAAIYQSDAAGSVVEYATFDSTGTLQCYVDDILVDTYTGPNPGGATTAVVRTISGLNNTKHKVEVRTTTTNLSVLIGIRVRGTEGLEVSNFGNGGSTSVNWSPTGNYHQNYKVMQTTTPSDILFLGLDGNEMFQLFSAETYRGYMQTLIAALETAGVAVILVPAPAMYPATGYANPPSEATWDAYMDVQYDLADQYDIPMLDTRHLYVTYAAANAAGWMGDSIHPNDTGHAIIARALAVEMLKTIPYDTKPDAMLEEYENVPTAPATGMKFFTKFGARRIPAFVAAGGQWSALQPALFSNRVQRLTVVNNVATPQYDGMVAPTYVNGAGSTPTAVAKTVPGTFFTHRTRMRLAGTAVAGTAGSLRTAAEYQMSATANEGGFFAVARFGLNQATATNRVFCGFSTTTAALAAGTNPSALLNLFGIACDAADTTFSFIHNDGSGAATKVSMGTGFPATTSATDFYEARIYAPPGVTGQVFWCLIRLNNGVQRQGVATTDLPAASTGLAFHLMHSNGTTASTASIDVQSLYIETDN